jgi:predicted PhzF superfamily epimerase YddE/YHI9
MGIPLYQVDAFTDQLFGGNPAAVCILNEPRDDHWLQNVAREMNLSETAFLQKQDDGFSLRWFTPSVEVDLCGHATLASAHILWEADYLWPAQQARFFTRSGLLTAERNDAWIELDFPATPVVESAAPPALLDAFQTTPLFIGKTRFDYLIEVASEAVLRKLQPDFYALRQLGVRGVIVTSRSTAGSYDFVSRFFAPGSGIDEDPATGSSHCALGPYWQGRLGKTEFLAYQASPRGGVLRVRVAGERVILAGKAVTVLRGELV